MTLGPLLLSNILSLKWSTLSLDGAFLIFVPINPMPLSTVNSSPKSRQDPQVQYLAPTGAVFVFRATEFLTQVSAILPLVSVPLTVPWTWQAPFRPTRECLTTA